jgi:hypothetical protein
MQKENLEQLLKTEDEHLQKLNSIVLDAITPLLVFENHTSFGIGFYTNNTNLLKLY